MIYKNCINYCELGPQPMCAIDTKGKNKYGICPGDPVPAITIEIIFKNKNGFYNKSNNSDSDKFYSVKPKVSDKISDKISDKVKIKIKIKNIGLVLMENMEVSGEILKKKYYTLQDAVKAAEEINKEGIKYDSIVKFSEKIFN